MVCHQVNARVQGSGILDNLMRTFTVRLYGEESHARSLDPNQFLQGYNYVGPHTEVLYRDKIGHNKPLNDLDATAKEHDLAYLREEEEYEKDHNKQNHMRNIHRADDVLSRRPKLAVTTLSWETLQVN